MWFDWNNLVLTLAQTACIALPAAGLPKALERFRGNAWALILPLSIAVVIGAIALVPSTADVLTWVALILVPIGAAIALGWAAHGARWWLAPLAVPLLVVAWTSQDTRWGQLAATLLILGSAVTAGRLLAGAAPLSLLKIGVVVMAAIDAYLVFSSKLQQPNSVLVAAAPAPGLPKLQSASFAYAGLGYGDFFAAAVVGGILAAERVRSTARRAAHAGAHAGLGSALPGVRRTARDGPSGARPDRLRGVATAPSEPRSGAFGRGASALARLDPDWTPVGRGCCCARPLAQLRVDKFVRSRRWREARAGLTGIHAYAGARVPAKHHATQPPHINVHRPPRQRSRRRAGGRSGRVARSRPSGVGERRGHGRPTAAGGGRDAAR